MENHYISRNIYRNLLRNFWKFFLIYILCMLSVGIGVYILLSQRIWYAWDRGYRVLHWLNQNILFVVAAGILAGGVVIVIIYFYRIARMIEEITQAVGVVYQGNDRDQIVLSEALHEVEMQLNQIMFSARDSRYKMEQMQRQKDDMVMYMAHDLKTPLTSVLGYLSLLKDEKDISEKTREHYLEIAIQKACRLEDLIHEFFDITRVGYSEIILNKTEVNLSRMLEQVLFEFQPIFDEKKLTYALHCPPELLVYCDVEQIQRVFDNLLKNVANYSYEASAIQITLEERKINDERQCLCIIKNHGATIPPEKRLHIFEQFYRLDSARESRTGGTGLGLAIVKQIIELHHGGIVCESENEVITFRFWLPL